MKSFKTYLREVALKAGHDPEYLFD